MKSEVYEFLPGLFLRAPFYPVEKYGLGHLPEVLQDPDFRQALELASPVFYGLLQAKGFAWAAFNEKERHTLAKYFNRMCYRPTPFGSFATFTNLDWGGGPVRLAETAQLHLVPDRALNTARFQVQRPFGPGTAVIKNPTLYRLGEHLRFFHTAPGPKGRFRFTIDQADAVDFNLGLLKLFDRGPVTAGAVMTWIHSQVACSPAEAQDYLRFLIEDQLLYTSGQGRVICPETPARDGSASPGDRKIVHYAAAERPLLAGGLPAEDQAELLAALRVLERLAVPAPLEALKNFIKDFQARFDRQKVPLLTALDPDAGIFYGDHTAQAAGHRLLDDLRFPAPVAPTETRQEGSRQFFLRRWLDNQRRAWQEPIVIGEDAFPADTAGRFPPTIALMFRKTTEHLMIESAGGASATPLIGRFSLFSETTAGLCREIAKAEQEANPEVVFADIEQLSDIYVDNINQRRPVYPCTIPLNVYPAVPPEQQLLPADLYLSVRGGELVLESKKLGKRVIPRLASAYNYHHNELPLFRLLGDLQFQGLKAGLGLDLAALFPGLPFYPRVVYRRVILSPARWVLQQATFLEFSQALLNLTALAEFCERLALPQFISVGQHDQTLVIDLREEADLRLLSGWLKGKTELVIQEYLPADRSVLSAGQPLAGQFVAFLVQKERVYVPLEREPHRPGKTVRAFVPGSDWLYFKLYCTPASANILLEKLVSPLIQKHQKRIRSWFFIRYADPGNHLRLRFRVKGGDTGQIFVALQAQLKKQQLGALVSDLRCETYQREVERYGARYMVQAEAVFCAGSAAVADFIGAGGPRQSELAEFLFALRAAQQLICIFYPGLPAAASFAEEVKRNFLKEFRADKDLKAGLDQKYRGLRPALTGALGEAEIPAALAVLKGEAQRLAAMVPAKNQLVKKSLLADVVHMQMNRTFRQNQRQQELLVYYCLVKYWRSALHRRAGGVEEV